MSSPELLVCLRVAGADAPGFERLLQAIRAQHGVDFHVVVVDDASDARCAQALARFPDTRVRLARHDAPQGPVACRERALALSAAPFVAELPERGEMLPGALARLHAACSAAPGIGLAHGNWLRTDADGRVPREVFRARRRSFLSRFGAEGDLRRDLLLAGDVLGPLRVYRREAFALLAAAPARGAAGAELAALVRIAARYEIATVADYVFSRPDAAPAASPSRGEEIAFTLREALACRRALASDPGRFARDAYPVHRLLATRVLRAAGLGRLAELHAKARGAPRRLRARALVPLGERIYYAAVERFAGRAASLLPRAAAPSPERTERRVAYYLWHFPVLSQTFINRELASLKRAGRRIDIIADEPEDTALADHNAAWLLEDASYLYPLDPAVLERRRRRARRQRPLAYARVLLFAVLSRHMQHKRLAADLALFDKAIYLAGALTERGTTHVHAPWADQCALVALLAARLAGIPYSVQARAHEIHRAPYRYGLADRLAGAAFVVTNTRYNDAALREILGPKHAAKLHVVRNGVDLERFAVPARPPRAAAPVAILCVARLIEQKGLVHLLDACRELERRGVDFVCDIVGGPEEPLYTTYLLELKRRHRRLGLARRVRFVGAQPLADVLERMRRADLFVLPCVIAADGSRDITPNALIEAMAMGLPVVSTAIGGVPEIVEHGVSGLIVPPADAAALADALEALVRDPQRSAALGAAARRRVEAKFDSAVNVRRYAELFAGVARAPRGVPARVRAELSREPGD